MWTHCPGLRSKITACPAEFKTPSFNSHHHFRSSDLCHWNPRYRQFYLNVPLYPFPSGHPPPNPRLKLRIALRSSTVEDGLSQSHLVLMIYFSHRESLSSHFEPFVSKPISGVKAGETVPRRQASAFPFRPLFSNLSHSICQRFIPIPRSQ